MKFTLPYPPSVNMYWRHRVVRPKGGTKPMAITYISKAGKDYKAKVAEKLRGYPMWDPVLELVLYVDLYPPDRRKRDVDNVLKAIMDSMEGLLYESDCQIGHVQVIRREPVKGGRIVIEITERDPGSGYGDDFDFDSDSD